MKRRFDLEDWHRFRRIINNPRDRALFATAYSHGLRAGDIAALRPSDVQLRRKMLYLRRRPATARRVPLLALEARDLHAWLQIRGRTGGALFPSRNHKPISPRRLDALLKIYCVAAGLPVAKASLRAFRSGCTTELVRAGQEPLILDWLGLRDPRSARRYVQQSFDVDSKAARGHCNDVADITGTTPGQDRCPGVAPVSADQERKRI